MGCPGSEGSTMSQDRDTPVTAAGDTNLKSIKVQADSRGGLVAAPVQDVGTSRCTRPSASALRGSRRTEHRRATTALHDRAIRRRDQTVTETPRLSRDRQRLLSGPDPAPSLGARVIPYKADAT